MTIQKLHQCEINNNNNNILVDISADDSAKIGLYRSSCVIATAISFFSANAGWCIQPVAQQRQACIDLPAS